MCCRFYGLLYLQGGELITAMPRRTNGVVKVWCPELGWCPLHVAGHGVVKVCVGGGGFATTRGDATNETIPLTLPEPKEHDDQVVAL